MGVPIGVFDSGVGGLTVLRALRALLPHENFIYLGDTARLPYGTKSSESVVRYSIQAGDALVARGIKCLVIACNTASAVALHALRERYAPLPVIGVLEPGAAGGVRGLRRAGALRSSRPKARCGVGPTRRRSMRYGPTPGWWRRPVQLFVALAEEGWIDGPLVEGIVRRYLEPIFAPDIASHPDCLLLGCTHFPVLQPVMRRVLDPAVAIVDSAETTARTVRRLLDERGLAGGAGNSGAMQLLATDAPARFARVGGTFFGGRIDESSIEPIDL